MGTAVTRALRYGSSDEPGQATTRRVPRNCQMRVKKIPREVGRQGHKILLI